jgi:hypothetical protein
MRNARVADHPPCGQFRLAFPSEFAFELALVPRRDGKAWEARAVDEDGRLGDVVETYTVWRRDPIPALSGSR